MYYLDNGSKKLIQNFGVEMISFVRKSINCCQKTLDSVIGLGLPMQ